MACLTFILIVALCIAPKVAASSCKDLCVCKDEQCEACNATGYNGGVCERNCSKGCLDGLCDAHTGVCLKNRCKENFVGTTCSSCIPGKFGESCLDECPLLCATCTSIFSCTSCYSGYFGNICDKRCPEGCTGNICDRTGKCYECKPNFVGKFCEDCVNDTLCNEDCLPNCLSCSSYNKCTDCMSGYYGEFCQLNCSHGCLQNKCHQGNGTCYFGCQAEFGGDFCQECVNGRYGANCSGVCPFVCKENICEKNTAHCLNGCNFARYGPTCEHSCVQKCETCSSNITCHSCVTGSWGYLCSLKCSKGCLGRCLQNGTCQNCKEGYYGSFCNLTCPSHCTDLRCTTEFIASRCEHCFNGTCNRDESSSVYDSGFDNVTPQPKSKCRQSYYVERIGWISVAGLFVIVTVLLVAYIILLKRRLAYKDFIIRNTHTGRDSSDINTVGLEMATFLALSEGTISSDQNQQSAVYELPRNTTTSAMNNGEDVSDDTSAHVYSGPYEQPIEIKEYNTYAGQHTNDTHIVGPYENVAAATSGATDSDVRRYEELTSARWKGNYSDLQEF